MQWVKPLFWPQHPIQRGQVQVPPAPLLIRLPANEPGKEVEGGRTAHVPVTRWEIRIEFWALGFSLAQLSIVATWEVKQQMEDLSVSPSLYIALPFK